MNTQQALLSNEANYTVFRFGDKTIRYRAPYSLERYTGIQEWDHGYLVVLAKYRHDPNPEEEYIDLVPILKNLYFDPDEFLAPIKGVKLAAGARHPDRPRNQQDSKIHQAELSGDVPEMVCLQ